MTDVMIRVGTEIEDRFMSAMNRGIEWVYDQSQSLKTYFSNAAEECGKRGSHFFAILNPHASHAPEPAHTTAHTVSHDDTAEHDNYGGWLDWRENSNKQQAWAVRVNDMMRKAGAAFSYFNLPSFFPKRPPTRSIHAPRFTHGARPEV